MRLNFPVTNNGYVLNETETIVSKTDLLGNITYVNGDFIRISGYSEEELMGAPQNIVRHPEMPRGVFKLFWDTLQQGKEIFAYVKNISMDGSHYWVLANVTPSVDAGGRVLGYYSVRRKPNPKAIAVVSGLYNDMLQAEQRAGSRDAMTASSELLTNFLKSKGQTYEQMVLSLQSL